MGWGWVGVCVFVCVVRSWRSARGAGMRGAIGYERLGVVAEVRRRGGERRSPWGSAQWKRLQDSDTCVCEQSHFKNNDAEHELS